jgi:hypothetical protein
MIRNIRLLVLLTSIVTLAAITGCGGSGGPSLVQISGTVSFKGKPVPAGYISFMPPVGVGSICVVQIKDGKFDSNEMVGKKGVHPGANTVRIAGFDGVVVKLWGQGKQIFNPYELEYTVADRASTKDFEIPESAGKNVRIEPTSDE